ncbi:hypothetical protein HPHPP41_0732 [Helicobacter pylori Hp P-41]|nr:hypothetical protein HPHPP41_0732 [Helicobacter pylori Hp P-41]
MQEFFSPIFLFSNAKLFFISDPNPVKPPLAKARSFLTKAP